jgi:hypothetical protein
MPTVAGFEFPDELFREALAETIQLERVSTVWRVPMRFLRSKFSG